MINISTFASKTVNKLSKVISIREEDREIYTFGLEMFFNIIISFFFLFLIGLVFNQIIESIIYGILFSVLRVYAGGFHFKSETVCFWFSLIVDFIAVFLIHYVEWNTWFFIPSIISALCLLLLCPVETPEKELYDGEKVVYRKRVRILLVTYFLLLFTSTYFRLSYISMTIFISIEYVTFLVLLGYLVSVLKK